MNLHIPLALEGAATEDVNLVPTKRFFKPVLVITAPIGRDEANLLEAAYLFDAQGNPQPFEGSVKLKGELAGASVKLTGATVEQIIDSEKVSGLALFREEKVGMKLRVRIHLTEDEITLIELLRFLAQLNKGKFTLTISDRQASLVTLLANAGPSDRPEAPHAWPAPDSQGNYDRSRLTIRPFKDGPLSAELLSVECEDGFRAGWSLVARFKAGEMVCGELPNASTPATASESEAVETAARELRIYQARVTPAAGKEAKACAHLDGWLADNVPGIHKDAPAPKEVLQ